MALRFQRRHKNMSFRGENGGLAGTSTDEAEELPYRNVF